MVFASVSRQRGKRANVFFSESALPGSYVANLHLNLPFQFLCATSVLSVSLW